MEMRHPFENDPFAIVWQAFQNLYPGKECRVLWYDMNEIQDDGKIVEEVPGGERLGVTQFFDTGEVVVLISLKSEPEVATETLAHELAHVAVGIDAEHGQAWEDAFEKIFQEYNRIGDEMFPDDEEDDHGQSN